MAQPSADKNFSIVMVGPRRTGKTSMLTAMYERFDTAAAGSNLVYEPNGLTKGKMLTYVAELMAIAKSPDLVSDESKDGILASGVEHRFEFSIRLSDDPENSPRCKLVWRDFPGAWLDTTTSAAGAHTSYRDALASSMFSMVTIDAPFLMEQNGKYHQARNKPSSVQAIYEAALADVKDRNRIVMLAPVRCEKYRATPAAARQLANRVKAEYSSLIKFLEPRSTLVVITPIETVGCLHFSHFTAAKDNQLLPAPSFRNTGGGYVPKDADQPLRYVLWQISNMLDEQVNPPGGFWAWIREWLDLSDPRFRAASAHLIRGLKGSDDGFEIVWSAPRKGKS